MFASLGSRSVSWRHGLRRRASGHLGREKESLWPMGEQAWSRYFDLKIMCQRCEAEKDEEMKTYHY